MIIKKENSKNLLLFLIGFFCLVYALLPKLIMLIYIGFCFFLFLISNNLKKIKFGLGFLWYFMFTLYCLFSLLYTINGVNPDFVYVRMITYLFMLFFGAPFLNDKENVRKILFGFFVGGLFGILYVFINQYKLIGIQRLGSIYGSSAEFGNICMVTLGLFYLFKNKLFKNKIIRYAVFVFIVFVMIASWTRKAILVSMLFLIFFQIFDKRKKMTKKIFILSLIGIFSLSFVYISLNNEYLYKTIGNRIESGISSVIGEEQKDDSLNERKQFKELAKNMIKEKPIQGWGIHSFALKNYVAHNYISIYLIFSHDGYLEILCCYGIIGFILFYWIFLYAILNYKLLLHDDISIFLFSFLVIILLMEPYSVTYLSGYYVMMIGSIGSLVHARRKKDEKSFELCVTNNS